MKNALRVVLLAVFLTTMIPGAAFTADKDQPEIVELKMHIPPFLSNAPLFIADDEGFFEDQGIKVDLIRGVPTSQTILFLVKGELDVWGGGISAGFFNSLAREDNFRIVAGKGYISPEGCTYTSFAATPGFVEEVEKKGFSVMKGMKVAAVPAGVQAYFLSRILEKGGMNLKDVEIVNLPNPARMQAVTEGSLDLVFTAEPWLTRIVKTGKAVVWMPAEKVIPGYQTAYLGFGERLREKDPDLGRRFMVAYLQGIRQYKQGKTERNLEIVARHTGQEMDLLKEACWPAYHEKGNINIDSVLALQEWALARGTLDKKVDVEGFWDPSFIEYALEVLGDKGN
jgi:NitT/TauT family transport system substrate-binding protein